MEKIIKTQNANRTAFMRLYDETVNLLQDRQNLFAIQGNFNNLNKKMEVLSSIHKELVDFMLNNDLPEENIDGEMQSYDSLANKFEELKLKIDNLVTKSNEIESQASSSKRKLNYPIIEVKKFGGDISDWLPFWSQFRRIHEDDQMDNEDKFQLLLQYTIPKSRAHILAESYPPTAKNYEKVIDSFKSRFGREDLLIEYFVRELLKLVIHNFNTKIKLSSLFDRLEAQLRSLETLGVTSDKFAAVLYPMVESCLPEETLRVWQRSVDFNPDSTLKNRLDNLMSFLKKEVEGEERIQLASSGFDLHKNRQKYDTTNSKSTIPTAADLINHGKQKCIFCKAEHSSYSCPEAMKMTLEEKRKILSQKGCCHLCLKFGHFYNKCRNGNKLKCDKCLGKHTTVMCYKENSEKDAPKPRSENLSNQTCNSQVFLQTMVVHLKNDKTSRPVRVIFDTGSQKSYVCKHTALEMGYEPLREEEFIHGLFGGVTSETVNHKIYRIQLESMSKEYNCTFETLDQLVICSHIQSIPKEGPWNAEIEKLNASLYDNNEAPVEVLIGADIAGKLFTGNKYELRSGLVLLETKLGWTIMGKMNQQIKNNLAMISTSMFNKNISISDLWNLETIGILDPATENSKKEKELAVQDFFVNTVSREENGRYIVRLPWIEFHAPLPTNYDISMKRLDNLMKKLDKDKYYEDYNQVFKEWLDEKIIEVVPEPDSRNFGHYLPHRHVVKLSTTKIRPVFDASAKSKTSSPSLNQCLEKGINLIELIPSILIRFRMGKIGVIADIKKAFLQIGLHSADREYLKFLWYNEHEKLITYRHARVVFGVTCSPYLLGAVINYHLEQYLNNGCQNYSSSTIDRLMKSFYIDNCVTSMDTSEEVQNFIQESKAVMSEAQFDLRLWETTILSQEEDQDVKVSSVLGLHWNRNLDTLELSFTGFGHLSTEHVTKKIILSVVNSIFDPNGFACPVLLIPKKLLQKTWNLKLDWNQDVPDDIKNTFLEWLKNLNLLRTIKIPRWILQDTAEKIESWELHLFCDASKDAYAAAVFVRTMCNQEVSIQLIQAKSRVAPIKKISIPRLELLAATIGARLLVAVKNNLEIENIKIYCWTDSTTILSWIKRQDTWKPFVKNRVDEIIKNTKPECWYHVPGQFNIADLPSRGCSSQQLLTSRWWEGPLWLKEDKKNWPKQEYQVHEDIVAEEISKGTTTLIQKSCNFLWYFSNRFSSYQKILRIIAWTRRQEDKKNWPKQEYQVHEDIVAEEISKGTTTLIQKSCNFLWYFSNRFSSYQKILRIIAWTKRFVFNCRQKKDERQQNELSSDEISNAERYLVKCIQEECFGGLKDKRISTLMPFFDQNNLLRVTTKISERKDQEQFCYPILLPAKHVVVSRLILHYHNKAFHVGVQTLMKMLRERFWIIGGRKAIKSVISKCIICRKFNTRRIETPVVPLPEDRVRDAMVFEITGMDFAGPLYLRNNEKVWISIFTCAVYRAVHLELVGSLSSESFLQAFRRFIARRGRPSVIYSDNATNYRGVENAFTQINWNDIEKYSSIQKIKWKFSPPTAAWWGGWWERLIRTLKQMLRKVLGKACLTYSELTSVLCECEAVMNSRPLTYVSEDINDLTCLSPSMFLQENTEVGTVDLDAIESGKLIKRYNYRKKVIGDLKKRFRSEYLGSLRMDSKKNVTYENIKVGSLVLIENDLLKRSEWPLGRIEKIFPGKDNHVRLVQVKTASGTFLRPIQRIYLLEMNEDDEIRRKHQQKENTINQQMSSEKQNFIKLSDAEEEIARDHKLTRYGRRIRCPNKLNL